MAATILRNRDAVDASNDLAGLLAHLAPLLGQPFRLLRLGVGDELTLHFGDLRSAQSAKLESLKYGSYVLGVRASHWVLRTSDGTLCVVNDARSPAALRGVETLGNADFESAAWVSEGARIVSITPFPISPADVYGIELRVADGAALLVLPDLEEGSADADDPPIADWELFSPNGHLSVGPGLSWTFSPAVR